MAKEIITENSLLSKSELKKREQMLDTMSKEIEKLEFDIKHSKYTNFKIGSIRNLKISLKVLQFVSPFILVAGLTIGGFALLEEVPFYRDYYKQELNIMKEYDSFGNFRCEQQYADYEQAYNRIFYYSKWEKAEDGLYKRTIETYEFSSKTEEEILNILNSNDITIKNLFGESILKKTEFKNNITDEELTSKAFLKAVVYNEDKNDYIFVKEDINDNIAFTLLYLLATILIGLVPYAIMEYKGYSLLEKIREIKEKHEKIDADELNKILTLKKENYDRLTRK